MHRFPLVPERLSLTAQGRTDSCEGPCPGRHMGRPLQIQLKPPSTPGGAGGDRAPPLPVYRGVQQRADVPKAWLPPTKFRAEIWGVGHGHRPLRGEEQATSTTQASGAEHLRQRSQGVGGTCGRDHPKVSSNLGQSLNRGIAATAPFAQGSLWPAGDEKAGGHIGPPLRGHRSAQQRQAGRDRARPLQKDGEYAEGWGDERTQGRFDIYRAVIGLVSRKAECPE